MFYILLCFYLWIYGTLNKISNIMVWVASTLHTTSESGVSNITTADAHTSAASSRLNWSPHRFKWNHPFPRKTKSGFCACAITFQTQSTHNDRLPPYLYKQVYALFATGMTNIIVNDTVRGKRKL